MPFFMKSFNVQGVSQILPKICPGEILFLQFLPSSAQAQAQLEAELALFSLDPAPHPPPPVKVYLAAYIKQTVTKFQCKAY